MAAHLGTADGRARAACPIRRECDGAAGRRFNQPLMKRPESWRIAGMTRLVARFRAHDASGRLTRSAVRARYCVGYPSDATTRFERTDFNAPGPARRHQKMVVRVQSAQTTPRPRSRSPIPRSRRARKQYNEHDVPIHHLVRHRASVRHAAAAPSSECLDSSLLRHERLHKLPRDRRADRHCPLPDLRVRPPRPLSPTASQPPSKARSRRSARSPDRAAVDAAGPSALRRSPVRSRGLRQPRPGGGLSAAWLSISSRCACAWSRNRSISARCRRASLSDSIHGGAAPAFLSIRWAIAHSPAALSSSIGSR